MSNIDVKILDAMSESELNNLRKEVYARLDDINEEKQRRKQLRENYKLLPFEFEYTYNHAAIVHDLSNRIKVTHVIAQCEFDDIVDNWKRKMPLDYEKIYTCPWCGNTSLRLHTPPNGIYYIDCNDCEFEVPKKYNGYYIEETWRNFHEYLIKHGYLDPSEKFPC